MNHESGFTLIEVMAAFVIAALATVVLLHAGFEGAAANRAAATYQQLVCRAQSRLASFGPLTRLRAETLSGDDGGGYRWQVRIATLQTAAPLALYGISLTETFGNRQLVLTTERLGPVK